jgi:hypothetical protein
VRFLGFQPELFMANFKLATRGPRRASVPPLTRLKLGACGAASAAAAASAGAGAFVQAAGGHKPSASGRFPGPACPPCGFPRTSELRPLLEMLAFCNLRESGYQTTCPRALDVGSA